MTDKKKVEKNCLEKTLAFIPKAPKYKKSILENLEGEIEETERPDFLISREDGTIGVEHFLIDTLIGRKKSSRIRTRANDISITFNRYHDCVKDNREEALKEIESIVQTDVDLIQKFDYNKFISEFKRITDEHLKQVNQYRECKVDLKSLVFLIELPVSINGMVGIKSNLNYEIIKGNRFPITSDMNQILKNISKSVDYTIISIMREDYKKCPFTVYTIDNKNFEESMSQQCEELYRKFAYKWQLYDAKIKVNLKLED